MLKIKIIFINMKINGKFKFFLIKISKLFFLFYNF